MASISGSGAISGLGGSGTDFAKTLKDLKKIESIPLNRMEAWKGDWKLRYDAFGKVIEQVQAASSMLATLSDRNKFVTKKATSSNENIVSAIANASAQDVQHTIKVSQVASNAIWANTGHIFDSKTDVINTSGAAQDFKYTYAGKDHTISVPANTTLDSFASMVNNSADNPGIKISLVKSGSGYVFQVAGKSTGAVNDLVIHDSNLVGMNSAGSTSAWVSNNGLDLGQALTNPTDFVYDLVMQDGSKRKVTIKGDATAAQMVDAFNAQVGGDPVASLDASGNLVLNRVKSYNRRSSTDKEYVPENLRANVGSDLTAKLNATGGMGEGKGDDDLLSFTMTLSDGNTRTFSIKAGASKRDLLVQMAQVSQSGSSVDINIDSSGSWGVNLSGVQSISSPDADMSKLNQTLNPASGVQDTQNATLTSANTVLTFGTGKLGDRIDGKTDGSAGTDLEFSVIKKDGTAVKITGLKSDMTNQQLMDKIKAELGGAVADDGAGKLTISDALEFRLTSGSSSLAGFSAKTETQMGLAQSDAFTEVAPGDWRLESPPDLKYEIVKNDGTKATVTLASGATMQDVVDAFTTELGAGNVKLVDKEGKDWDPATSTGKPYLNIKDIASAGGPGLKGQVAESSNWSIQRAANSRYQVDNWPTEMESDSNSVADVIDGVIFNIQAVGDARISVSTDIPAVEQSIQNFLDAVNSVLLTVRDFTIYDKDKEVTSSDPNDIGKDNYSPSHLTSEKGGLLQGNYGIQLFNTRFKGLLNGSPPGFKARQSADDILSGDILSNLANLGIKTNTDESSDGYGLLEIAPKSSIAELTEMDKKNYSDMITNNLEAVVDFFCTSGTGSSTSSDFRYGSHVQGITKAGTYDVTYDVDASGAITKVMVGGVEATRDDSKPGYYYSVGSGDARGLAIQIDNLAPGAHSGQVRIKQGLVQTVDRFFKDELTYTKVDINANSSESQMADAIALKSKNGSLMVLRENYQGIMDNIDKKIQREQTRIATWEKRQKTVFANLETLLKQYSEQQKRLESQIGQLSGGS